MEINASKQKLVSGFSTDVPPAKSEEKKKQPELDPGTYPPATGAGLAAYFEAQTSLSKEMCEGTLKEAGKSLGDKFGAPLGGALGGAVGAKAGPKGAIAGAAVGGFLGAVFGKAAGEIAGKQVAKVVCGESNAAAPAAAPASPMEAPDAGGPVLMPKGPNASTLPAGEPAFTHVDPSKNKSG